MSFLKNSNLEIGTVTLEDGQPGSLKVQEIHTDFREPQSSGWGFFVTWLSQSFTGKIA